MRPACRTGGCRGSWPKQVQFRSLGRYRECRGAARCRWEQRLRPSERAGLEPSREPMRRRTARKNPFEGQGRGVSLSLPPSQCRSIHGEPPERESGDCLKRPYYGMVYRTSHPVRRAGTTKRNLSDYSPRIAGSHVRVPPEFLALVVALQEPLSTRAIVAQSNKSVRERYRTERPYLG